MKNQVLLHNNCECGSDTGIITKSGDHKKLSCALCGKYIKFVGKSEVYKIVNNVESNLNLLKEINFKLDLILDHLNIIE